MVRRQELAVRSRDGLSLQAALDRPDEVKGAVVLCHPHPKMGGTMAAPLLVAVKEELVARGWAVLRFNFRGIGESEGEPSTGVEEVDDAKGALDAVREQVPGAPVALAGWSFGGAVAIRVAARDSSLVACVAIAPSVVRKPGVTEGLPEPAAISIGIPLLMVCAANDDVADAGAARTWADAVPGARIDVLKGANHFFWGKYDDLAATVGDFLDGVLAARAGGAAPPSG